MIGAALAIWLAFQASPSEAVRHLHAGVEADKRGQLDLAVSEFQKATQLDPAFAPAFLDLGQAYIEQRAYASAVTPTSRRARYASRCASSPRRSRTLKRNHHVIYMICKTIDHPSMLTYI